MIEFKQFSPLLEEDEMTGRAFDARFAVMMYRAFTSGAAMAHIDFRMIRDAGFSICRFCLLSTIRARVFPMASKSVDMVVIPSATTSLRGVSL